MKFSIDLDLGINRSRFVIGGLSVDTRHGFYFSSTLFNVEAGFFFSTKARCSAWLMQHHLKPGWIASPLWQWQGLDKSRPIT